MRSIGAGLVGPYSAMVSKSGNQTANNNTTPTITFDVVGFNNGAVYSGGQPTRLTAQVAGRYVIIGEVAWSAGTGGASDVRHALIGKNNAVFLAEDIVMSSIGLISQHVSVIVNLAAGDYVELFVSQASGSNVPVLGGQPYQTNFSMALLAGQ